MVSAERLRNSYVVGAIDKFGTVRIAYHVQPGPRRKDYEMRVYSPLLHKYADDQHRACLRGAVLQILDRQGDVVATLTPRQIEATGTEALGRVTRKGFVIDPRADHDGDCEELDRAAGGIEPSRFDSSPRARVDPVRYKQAVVVFWLDDDYVVAFTPDGEAITAAVEYPLHADRWAK